MHKMDYVCPTNLMIEIVVIRCLLLVCFSNFTTLQVGMCFTLRKHVNSPFENIHRVHVNTMVTLLMKSNKLIPLFCGDVVSLLS